MSGTPHLELSKPVLDTASAFVVVGSILQLLPPIAAGFAIVWYILQMKDRARRIRLEKQNTALAQENKKLVEEIVDKDIV